MHHYICLLKVTHWAKVEQSAKMIVSVQRWHSVSLIKSVQMKCRACLLQKNDLSNHPVSVRCVRLISVLSPNAGAVLGGCSLTSQLSSGKTSWLLSWWNHSVVHVVGDSKRGHHYSEGPTEQSAAGSPPVCICCLSTGAAEWVGTMTAVEHWSGPDWERIGKQWSHNYCRSFLVAL